ncbi:MAG TPA: histidine kinase [Solirubrobacteraceae bacterium]|jgi:signal transduction histidine kinase
MLALYRWFTRGRFGPSGAPASAEAIALRCFGAAYLAVFLVETFTSRPHPGLHGRGAVILAATLAFAAAAICAQPQRPRIPARRRIAALAGLTGAAAVLAVVQPEGIWTVAPIFVAIVVALRLERLTGVLTLACSLAVLVVVAAIAGDGGGSLSLLIAAVVLFLVLRLMRQLREQGEVLADARAAEARAAERGRLAREMHDVLAHSLSALALALESTRLLARDRGVDDELVRALDQAHHLAAGGLQEARRAIAAARGEELPGPDRIGVLADAFAEQSGLPVAVEVHGEPRELAPDARLALYRTAQEALTNVRRHAAAQRIEIELAYLPEGTVLVVADHARAGVAPPVALGLGGDGYGLTGMRERAELLGGELLAAPTDDGFRVELRLPA